MAKGGKTDPAVFAGNPPATRLPAGSFRQRLALILVACCLVAWLTALAWLAWGAAVGRP